MKTALISFLTLLAVAAVALLGVETYYTVTDHLQADRDAAVEAKAERQAAADKVSLISDVTAGLQRLINDDKTMPGHAEVLKDMILFKLTEDGTEYRGMVSAQTPKGTQVPMEITVWSDDSSMMYEIDPASQIRLKQKITDEQPYCAVQSC